MNVLRILLLLGTTLIGCFYDESHALSVKKTRPDRRIDFKMDVNMPSEHPPTDEAYVCTSFKVPRSGFAIGFNPTAHAERIHHMLLFGCDIPGEEEEGTWSCVSGTCKSGQTILYAWARNAPALKLPPDVGAPIGGSKGPAYLVLQIHYARKFIGNVWDYTGVTLDMVSEEPPFVSAIFLFATGGPSVPPNTSTHFMNMSCTYEGSADLYPFAFRTHTHGFGRVVSASIYRDKKWTLIGKRNPQWPQIFQKIETPLVIHSGDVLAGQCRYNSTGHMEHVNIGAHGNNEMCNFYMMFFRDAKAEDPFRSSFSGCGGSNDSELFSKYPEEAYGLLPPHPELEMDAHQSSMQFGVIEKAKWTSAGKIAFGQISGLSFDLKGNLVVFHRGNRVWGQGTFDYGNKLVDQKHPIDTDPVLTIDADSGRLLSSWGANTFFVPHGITVDSKGNVWLTDVGLQQVFKYVPGGQHMKVDRTWGERFVPGKGKNNFCKPTAVAVLKDGSFYVADGYCNNRIVHFGPDGSFVNEIGSRTQDSSTPLGTFLLPHDIGIHEEMNHLHVADRENGRLQVLFFNGTPAFDIRPPEDFLTVYSSDYSVATDEFYLIPGEQPKNNPSPIKAFAASPRTHLTMYSWTPKSTNFVQPHILRVSPDGSHVYVGEIGGQGGILWKFEIHREKHSKSSNTDSGPDPSGEQDSVNKPGESTDSGAVGSRKGWNLLLVLAVAVVVPALLVALLCVCLRFRKQGGFRAANILTTSGFRDKKIGRNGLNGAFRSHKGFQPLSTEDIDAVDDLTEDESENEDTLFPVQQKRGPMNT